MCFPPNLLHKKYLNIKTNNIYSSQLELIILFKNLHKRHFNKFGNSIKVEIALNFIFQVIQFTLHSDNNPCLNAD